MPTPANSGFLQNAPPDMKNSESLTQIQAKNTTQGFLVPSGQESF